MTIRNLIYKQTCLQTILTSFDDACTLDQWENYASLLYQTWCKNIDLLNIYVKHTEFSEQQCVQNEQYLQQ